MADDRSGHWLTPARIGQRIASRFGPGIALLFQQQQRRLRLLGPFRRFAQGAFGVFAGNAFLGEGVLRRTPEMIGGFDLIPERL